VALQSSGAISIQDLKTEFGDTGSSSLSEFYRGGGLVPNTGTNIGVPTSGEIQLSDFYGAAATGWEWTQTYTSMNEGVTRTFQFEDTSGATTSGTFNWSINGTTSDFNAVSGSGTINSSSQGSFSITTKNDAITEGTENYTVSVTYSSSTILTQAFSLLDTSLTPVTINVARSTTSVNEGSSFTFNATATAAITGTVNFSLGGTATGGGTDYSTSGASGFFTFSNSTTSNSVTISTIADNTTDGTTETVSCTINSPSVSGFDPTIGTGTLSVEINDTSTGTATYSLTSNNSSVNEGGSFSITFATNQSGSFAYTITGVSSSDINGASLTGSVSNGSVLNFSVTEDSTTEGTETFTISLDNGEASESVTIYDTSTAPASYAFTSASYNVTEGSSASIGVTTTNVANGTTLYWSLASDPGNDIITDSGSFTISSNSGSFSVSALFDSAYTESTETLTLQLRTGSTSGAIQDTANLNIINVGGPSVTTGTTTYRTYVQDITSGGPAIARAETYIIVTSSSSGITVTLDGEAPNGSFGSLQTNSGNPASAYTVSAPGNNLSSYRIAATGGSGPTDNGNGLFDNGVVNPASGYSALTDNTSYTVGTSRGTYMYTEAEIDIGPTASAEIDWTITAAFYFTDSFGTESGPYNFTIRATAIATR